MTALPAHPNVMPISFFHSTSDNDLLAMPLATGGDTLQLMQERNGVALPGMPEDHIIHD
jgi:flavin reductase (DIM6/NTAB) family NADH-FMN oxidoreductase RutF